MKNTACALAVVLCTSLISITSPLFTAQIPRKGTMLSGFRLPAPGNSRDREYLGLKGDSFDLPDLECRVSIIEILAVYCPLCHQQLPAFNKLFARLNRKDLSRKVKMFGVAIGATEAEVEFLRSDASFEYPVVQDEQFTIHKMLGEPKTPFTMVVTAERNVIYAHQGVIDDIDTLYNTIVQAVGE